MPYVNVTLEGQEIPYALEGVAVFSFFVTRSVNSEG